MSTSISLLFRTLPLALGLAAFSLNAIAATFTVTSTANSGSGSLRQAILDANAAPSPPHTILFSANYPLGGRITLASNLPTLNNGRISFNGNIRSPVIDGDNQYSILVAGFGTTRLDVNNLQFEKGRRISGGCIALQQEDQQTSLTIAASRFAGCVALANGAPRGGAIDWPQGSGTIAIIEGSTFTGNRTAGFGASNQGGGGGALSIRASVSITQSVFEENFIDVGDATSGGLGGAVSLVIPPDGLAILTDNRFRFNSATPITLDGLGAGGAVFFRCEGPCTVGFERNYFRGNTARRGGAIRGPGTFGSGGVKQVSLINNSFFNNEVLDRGGAVFLEAARLSLIHNSFFNNGADAGAHLWIASSVQVSLVHNLLAATSSGGACSGFSNSSSPGLIVNNLSQAACTVIAPSDVTVLPTLSNPLPDETQRVGVLRFTRVGAVIDAIALNSPRCAELDARGNSRPIDGNGDGVARCDLGAFEHPFDDLIFSNGFQP